MSKEKREARQRLWQQQLEAWQTSGLSAVRFAQEHGLSYHQLIYWRQKLLRASRPAADNGAGAGFARVVRSASPGGDGLCLHLPGGVRVTGIDHGNVDVVLSILRQL